MADFELIIRGAKADIGISGRQLVRKSRVIFADRRKKKSTQTSLVVFPGVIDAHVHFNEPGRTDWEGWATGSRAAAVGGTTTVFEMPLNAQPPTIDGESFDLKRAAAKASSLVDFGLWGGLVPGNLDQLKTLRDRGVVGLKAFMCNSGIGDFASVDLKTLRDGMKIAAELNLLVAVHAESEEMTARLTKESLAAGKSGITDYLESRPIGAELEAIGQAIEIASETGCKLHIVHVSSADGVEAVAKARREGVDVTCETCPHYLVLTSDDLEKIGATAKCAPPLRSRAERELLWQRLNDVTTIGSDHSPSPPELKECANFFQVWGGISGCQHLLPLLFDLAEQKPELLTYGRIAELTSSQVAARFAVPRKGGIAVGKDADLTLVDADQTIEVTAASLQYRHRQTPYLGRKLRGRVVRSILRGKPVYKDGKVAGRPAGALVRPELS